MYVELRSGAQPTYLPYFSEGEGPDPPGLY